MPLGRILVEKFQPEVIEWLRARAEVVVVDPWAEPERWDREAPQVDAVISRKGRITRRHIEDSRGRLKIVARTGVGVDVSRVDVDAAREHQVWVMTRSDRSAFVSTRHPPSSTTTSSSIRTPPKPGMYTPGSMVNTMPGSSTVWEPGSRLGAS